MYVFAAVLVCYLAFTAAKPSETGGKQEVEEPKTEKGPGPGGNGPPSHGLEHGGPPTGGLPTGRPPTGGPHSKDAPKIPFVYEPISRVAGLLGLINQDSNKDFGRVRVFWMLHSPVGRAISEIEDIHNFLLTNDIDDCRYNSSINDYRKKNAEVVNTCMAGWRLNTTQQEKIKSVINSLKQLDDEAKSKLGDCKPDEGCYKTFLKSDLKKSIDEKLKDLRVNSITEIRSIADHTTFAAVGKVAFCVTRNSFDLRKEIYSAIAELNACVARYGVLPNH